MDYVKTNNGHEYISDLLDLKERIDVLTDVKNSLENIKKGNQDKVVDFTMGTRDGRGIFQNATTLRNRYLNLYPLLVEAGIKEIDRLLEIGRKELDRFEIKKDISNEYH